MAAVTAFRLGAPTPLSLSWRLTQPQRPRGPRRARRTLGVLVAVLAALTALSARCWLGDGGAGAKAAVVAAASGISSGLGLLSSMERELLPVGATPLRYSLELDIDPRAANGRFYGRLAVALRLTDISDRSFTSASVLTLHARNLSVQARDVRFRSAALPAEGLRPKRVVADLAAETIALYFDEPLPGGDGTVFLSYTGHLGAHMAGLYLSEQVEDNGQRDSMVLTQFEAIDARRMLPCWDEPSKKAVFSLTLTFPSDLMAVSNMPPISETLVELGLRMVKFADTPLMSTYLLALAVGKFDSIQRVSSQGVMLRVIARSGQAEAGRFALDVAARALDFYSTYFKVPYPLPKLDMLAAPDFAAGAMENWGLVIYREVDLLCDIATVSTAQKMRIATVVTHELAHMWFGNLVTMEWWDDLWLNEGFANWMQTHAADVLFPEWHIWEQYIVKEQSRALALDALRSSHPIEVPIRRAQEVDEVFDAISYSKGGSVVRMAHGFLGPALFREGLVLYMQRHAYNSTDSTDLWICWEQVSGRPIRAMMESWTRQQGFPLLVVEDLDTSAGHTGALRLSQRCFFADGSQEPGDDKKLWHLPLLPGPEAWLDTKATPEVFVKHEIVWQNFQELNASWIKFNFGQWAPYRVLYKGAWLRDAQAQAVRAGLMSAEDRIGILFDSLALAREGSLPVAELLRLLASFGGEAYAHVWEALAGVLAQLHRAAAFLTPTASSLAARLSGALGNGLVRPALRACGWEPGKGKEGDLARQRRALIVAMAATFLRKDEDVIAEAQRRLTKWLETVPGSIAAAAILPDDFKEAVFRIALSGDESLPLALTRLHLGPRDLHEALRKRARQPSTPQPVRLAIYGALGAATAEDLRAKTLQMALGGRDGVRLQDLMYPIQSVAAADPAGARQAWRWLLSHRGKLQRRLKGANVRLLGAVMRSAAGGVLETAHANAVEAYFRGMPLPGLERSVAQAVETIRSEARFVSRLAEEAETPSMAAALAALEAMGETPHNNV